MSIKYKYLEPLTIVYIYFNVILFVGGWLRLIIAIPIIVLFLYVFYKKCLLEQDEKKSIFIEKKIITFIIIGIIIWLIASGIGGFCYQSGDWDKHNAILHDLVNYKWPVVYKLSEGDQGLMSYYIFSYLFPALIGKIGGFQWAELALLLQSVIGVFLVYLHLCYFLKAEKRHKQILVFVLLVLFGGIVLVGRVLYGYFNPDDLIASFHWFSNTVRIQYSSHIVLMRWVFPQCIVPWLATMLFLENPEKMEDFAWVGIPVFMYSCFAFVGLVPFYVGMAIYLLFKEKDIFGWLKRIFSLQNMYAVLGVFPICISYIGGNVFQEKPDIANFHLIDYSGNWILYAVFCLSNFLIWSFIMVKNEYKNPIFYIANIVLLALPLFWYGAWNDLCMRASIPAFFVIAVLFYKFMLNFEIRGKFQQAQLVLYICLICVAAVPQVNELYKSAKLFSVNGQYRRDNWGTLSEQLVRDGTNDEIAYNYVAYDCEDSFFIKYIARRTENE